MKATRRAIVLGSALVVQATLVVWNLVHHAMWLDELHAWCLVRDAHSFSDLVASLRNEGHPWLWYALLFPLAHYGLGCVSMQVLHGLIAITTAAMVLYRSPLPITWRVLVVFGYFFVFEYAAISRDYAIGALLLFIAADQFQRGGRSLRWLLPMVLLPQTHFWGIGVACAWLVVDAWCDRNWHRWRALSFALIGCSAAFALACAWPAEQLAYSPEWGSTHGLGSAAGVLAKVFFPLPDLHSASPWNMSLIYRLPSVRVAAVGIIVWSVVLIALPTDRYGRLIFTAITFSTLLLPFTTPFAFVRYGGPVLLGVIAVPWITFSSMEKFRKPMARWCIVPVLALQVVGGCMATFMGTTRIFSNAGPAVRWLEEQGIRTLLWLIAIVRELP